MTVNNELKHSVALQTKTPKPIAKGFNNFSSGDTKAVSEHSP